MSKIDISKIFCSGCVFFMLGFGVLDAQQSSNAAGGDANGSTGKVAYTVGEIVYTTHTDYSGSVAQGVQHAYEIITVSIEESVVDISLVAFPNPTTDYLILQIGDYNQDKLKYVFYDMQGKVIDSGRIDSKQTKINTSLLPAGTYYGYIRKLNGKGVQSFEIIKAN